MDIETKVITILQEVLQLSYPLNKSNQILGIITEFDSMSVIMVLLQIEEDFNIVVDDDEISADIFESVETLINFVENRI